ncbi:MAG: hypothetical protein HY900_34385, partial [Deltaproteobacteria bacterium]|nr:hypothetical protein [Deltaproteobacteria bacterium]
DSLSDVQGSGILQVTLGYTGTWTRGGEIHGLQLTALLRPVSWVLASAGASALRIRGQETYVDEVLVDDVPTPRETTFTHRNSGLGDVTLWAWAELAHFVAPDPGEGTQPRDSKEAASGPALGFPSLFVGLGVKLPTGRADEWDPEKLAWDRSKAISGESSSSDGVLSPRFQLGTGTTDLLAGILAVQKIGDLAFSASGSLQIPGGANEVGYERSPKASWSASVRWVLHSYPGGREISVRAGLSGVLARARDIDHSENTRLLGSQEKGLVDGSNADFVFADLAANWDFRGPFTVGIAARLPVGSGAQASENSFRFQLGFSLGGKF